MKTCSSKTCSQINPQPLENFGRHPKNKNGTRPRCKICINSEAQHWRTSNPEKMKKYNKDAYWKWPEKNRKKARAGRFKAKYWPELTLKEVETEWERIYAEQEGKCSICKKLKLLEVEHCHKTGKIRSLACNGCNTALARIYENPAIASALIEYIARHSRAD